MLIDRILYPIVTLGPGKRLVIWTVGCSKHCYNCANSELWAADNKKDITSQELFEKIIKLVDLKKVDGVTFTGGDPLEQFDELLELLELFHPFFSDILVYTGYTVDEARKITDDDKWRRFTELISVLIDGPYVDELNDNMCGLRGSTNQNIIYFNDAVKDRYTDYLSEGRNAKLCRT